MSASKESSSPSKRKRKHHDEEVAATKSSKKSRIDQPEQRQNHQNETSTHIAGDVDNVNVAAVQRSSRASRRTKRRMRRASEKAKADSSASDALNSSITERNLKSERKDGSLKAEREHGKESKEARKQRKAERRSEKAAMNASNGNSKMLVEQNQSWEGNPTPDTVSHSWTTSNPSAGRLLDHDPLFVQDENGDRYLVSSNGREVQVLSLETSLIARTHPAPGGKSVVCFAQDASSSYSIIIAYNDGSTAKWEWTNDHKPHRWLKAETGIIAMDSALSGADGSTEIFSIAKVGRQHEIFRLKQSSSLYSTSQQLRSILVVGNCEYLVCYGPSTLIIGRKKNQEATSGDFVFLEIPLSTTGTCIDARVVSSNKKGNNRDSHFSLAIGHENGQIYLYEDLSSLFSINIQRNHDKLPTPRILHWHREDVSSVKFSRDGNYLISVGKETVLVIWQLSTGKKQFLPHLTSEIERIVVAPEGDRYAVQMGDNSIMVLSTSELKPVAHFAGLQTIAAAPPANRTGRPLDRRTTAAALHPTQPQRLLAAVPSSQPRSQHDDTSRPFLQTFDIRHSRHISRQSLTRNNVTDFNLGPERTPIIPPDVVHIAISQDGTWLATVDEWMPPVSDLEHLYTDTNDVEEERQKRREVYLKIWHWDEQDSIWTLSTRIDAPHTRSNGDTLGAGLVLALQSDPVSIGFATIGEDSCVRFWKPKRRRRDTEDVEWRCRWTLQLPKAAVSDVDDAFDDLDIRHGGVEACMAFSDDGSLLAVSLRQSMSTNFVGQQTPMVHFIDTSLGTIATTKSGLAKTQIHALGFLGLHFIAVAQPAAYVWDLVEETLLYKIELSSDSKHHHASPPMLTTNPGDDTFAISTDRKRLEVYRPRQSTCFYKQKFEREIEAVLSGKGMSGFVLIFEDATVRTVSPTGRISSESGALPDGSSKPLALPAPGLSTGDFLESEPASNLDDETSDPFASSSRLLIDSKASATVREEVAEDDRPVVRPEQLASIFDVPHSFAMPPVKDMFQAIVGLFGRKPLQTVQ